MSTNVLLSVFLLASYLMCLSTNSWLTIWALLEINTICFCSIVVSNNMDTINGENEGIINYLIIQSIASSVLILTALVTNEPAHTYNTLFILLCISLLINIAAAPFYQWFINVSNNSNWIRNSILFTWQKLAPVYLLIFLTNNLLILAMIFSATWGAILIINTSNLNNIIAFSSVFNLSWMMVAISISTKIYVVFSILYWITVGYATLLFININVNSITEIFSNSPDNNICLLVIINVAGLPPMLGFMINWMTLSLALTHYLNIVVSFLLIISAVNLYVYLRLMNNYVIENSLTTQNNQNQISNVTNNSFIILNAIALIVLSI